MGSTAEIARRRESRAANVRVIASNRVAPIPPPFTSPALGEDRSSWIRLVRASPATECQAHALLICPSQADTYGRMELVRESGLPCRRVPSRTNAAPSIASPNRGAVKVAAGSFARIERCSAACASASRRQSSPCNSFAVNSPGNPCAPCIAFMYRSISNLLRSRSFATAQHLVAAIRMPHSAQTHIGRLTYSRCTRVFHASTSVTGDDLSQWSNYVAQSVCTGCRS